VKCLRTSIMVLLSLLYPFVASALDVSGQSRTYLFSRQTVDSERLLPLYEYLDFRADSGDKGRSHLISEGGTATISGVRVSTAGPTKTFSTPI